MGLGSVGGLDLTRALNGSYGPDAVDAKLHHNDRAVPDIATLAAWDGTRLIEEAVSALGADTDGLKYIDFMKGKKFDSPRGPVEIDPVERDIIQNVYIRQVEKRNGTLVNIDIDEVKMVKDPWKIDNPPKSN